MADLWLTDAGDVVVSHSGDFEIAAAHRDALQAAYIRIMTDAGDYLLYPNLGASLSQLYGLPQSPQTGRLGEQLIAAALNREGRFVNAPFTVRGIPTGPSTLKFDVEMVSGSRETIKLSVEQDLIPD